MEGSALRGEVSSPNTPRRHHAVRFSTPGASSAATFTSPLITAVPWGQPTVGGQAFNHGTHIRPAGALTAKPPTAQAREVANTRGQ